MRHRKSGRSLSRNWEHRKAMFRNMAKSLVVHERIRTTVPKARELSKVADRLITLALKGDLSAKREAYRVLGNHKLVKRLFDEIGPKFESATGGYTRVVKFARPRRGDGAALALIEFSYNTGTEPEVKKPSDKPQKGQRPGQTSVDQSRVQESEQKSSTDSASMSAEERIEQSSEEGVEVSSEKPPEQTEARETEQEAPAGEDPQAKKDTDTGEESPEDSDQSKK